MDMQRCSNIFSVIFLSLKKRAVFYRYSEDRADPIYTLPDCRKEEK